jgi:hypothetical protein
LTSRAWRGAIRARLGDREDLGLAGVIAKYWSSSGLPANDIEALLIEFQISYRIPGGVLRPNDPLRAFQEPVPASNPLTDAFYRFWTDESWSDINYELGKRMHKRGQTRYAEGVIQTIDDLVWAWCGRLGPNGDHVTPAT